MSRRSLNCPRKRTFTRWTCFHESLKSCWNEFKDTNCIHGITHLSGDATSWLTRIIWGIIVLVCCMTASALIYYFWLRYMDTSTRTTVLSQHVPTATVLFPAVTICPPNMISLGKINNLIKLHSNEMSKHFDRNSEIEKIYRAVVQVAGTFKYPIANRKDLVKFQDLLDIQSLDIFEFVHNISISCEDLLIKCRWNQRNVSCGDIFSKILTFTGYCCTFNLDLNNQKQPLYADNYGLFSGLDISVNSFSITEYAETTIRIFIHDSQTFPTSINYAFTAAEKKESALAFNVNFITSDRNIRELTQDRRKCVFKDEYRMKYFPSFTYENCVSECQIERFKKVCGCVPHYLGFAVKLKTKLCSSIQYFCIVKHFQDVQNIQESSIFSDSCKCPLECDLLLIDGKLSEWEYKPGDLTVDRFYNGISADHSILHIFFARSTTVEFTKVLSLQGIMFIANLGGIISFFLGCSFLSFLDVFYLFGYTLVTKYRQMRKDSIA